MGKVKMLRYTNASNKIHQKDFIVVFFIIWRKKCFKIFCKYSKILLFLNAPRTTSNFPVICIIIVLELALTALRKKWKYFVWVGYLELSACSLFGDALTLDYVCSAQIPPMNEDVMCVKCNTLKKLIEFYQLSKSF